MEAWLDVNGELVSTAWWVFAPGSDVATVPQINAMLGGWYLFPIAELLPILSTDTSVSFLRCVTPPANGITVDFSPAPNLGALDGTTALNAALVWTYLTPERRIGAHTHSWLPLSRSNLGADKRRLGALAYAEASAQAGRFLSEANSVTSPDGGSCVLVALHRQRAGVPLSSSLMVPIVSAVASPIVGTLQRRAASAPRAPSHI